MPIQSGDVRFMRSQIMADVPEGGGGPTGLVVPDGQSNAIFPDVSEVDRTVGRIMPMKVHLAVNTPDTDTAIRAHVIIAEPPADPNVSITLFGTKRPFDRRSDAKNRMESYTAPGPPWPGYLLENHIENQGSIQIMQQVGTEMPAIGSVLYLVKNEGLETQAYQYVGVTRATGTVRTFYSSDGKPYQALVVKCDLRDPLLMDFNGSPPSEFFKRLETATLIRESSAADAADYYGVSALTQPAAIGDLALQVNSIFSQLVPSAQVETPLNQYSAAGQSYAPIQSDDGTVSYTTVLPFNSTTVLSVGNAIYPGSLVINAGGELKDQGGQLLADGTVVGTVDYARGEVRFAATAPEYAGSKTVTFRPAGAPLQLADTAGLAVTPETRAYNWQLTLATPPAPGTAFASYRSGGKWYDLRDNGAGVLKGADSSFGVGTVSYATNTIALTCGALPDVGTDVIFGWGARVNYMNRAGAAGELPRVCLQLGHQDVAPGTLSVTWNDGTLHTLTDDGHGKLLGAGVSSSRINYTTGQAWFTPAVLPAVATQYQCAYAYGPPDTQSFPAPLRNPDGTVTLALARQDLTPGTLEMTWNLLVEDFQEREWSSFVPNITRIDPYKTVRDNGLGTLVDANGLVFGSVNYAAGTLTFTPEATVSIPKAQYAWQEVGSTVTAEGVTTVKRYVFTGFRYQTVGAFMPYDESGLAHVTYRATDAATSVTESVNAQGLTLDLTQFFSETIVPGSVNFTLGGKTYFDRLGVLYYDLEVTTGSAIPAGTLNYQTGAAAVSAWAPGQALGYALKSLLTSLDGRPVDEVTFRIPAAPVKPGSFQLLATALQGGQVSVSADLGGSLSAANVTGKIDYEVGVVRVRFGRWVVAAGNEGEIWYSADAVGSDGKIFRPAPVFADTIRYNAVAYSYLPLSAELLGMDPVRLPQDGRVPIYRAGGLAVLGHRKTTAPIAVAAGQAINLARTRLSRVRVVGADNAVIHTGYSADLEAGLVTFADVTGYAQPIRIEDRIEDLVLVRDVQINGTVTVSQPVTHAYPAGSFLSSALMCGDLFARVLPVFDQYTWDGKFSGAVVGAEAAGTYNDVDYPVQVTNEGAITQLWALRFTSNSAFDVLGEDVGVIGVGTINSVCAPINPRTGKPYFVIPELGWGKGWVPGNVLFVPTIGAQAPVWLVRTVQQGPETGTNYAFALLARYDVDNPL